MFCHNCGFQAAEDDLFCQECGTKLLRDEPVSRPSKPPASGPEESQFSAWSVFFGVIGGFGKLVSGILSFAAVLLLVVSVLNHFMPGSVQQIVKPGFGVRDAYLTQFSEDVTVEDAFEDYFENGTWSTYKEGGYSYVTFTGSCEYLGDRCDARVVFKITGEQFIVDHLDLNGRTQSDPVLYALLSDIYKGI